MPEDMGDKTEAPTPRRRIEAREQGNVARSQDLTAAVLMLSMLMMLNWFGAGVVQALRGVMERTLSAASMSDFSATHAAQGLAGALTQVGVALSPIFAGAILVIVAVNMAQIGLNFNTKKLQPNLMALNPFKGVGKLFGGPK